MVGNPLNDLGDESIFFYPGNIECGPINIGIVGNPGTGKTQVTKSIVTQLTRSTANPYGGKVKFLIFDYNGDYTDDKFLKVNNAKVFKAKGIPINFFDTSDLPDGHSDSEKKVKKCNAFWDIMKRIYSGLGPVQERRFIDCVMRAYEQAGQTGNTPTLHHVASCYDAEVSSNPDAVTSILDKLTRYQDIFQRDAENTKPFTEIFKQTIVLDLSELGAEENTQTALVVIFLNLYYDYLLCREKLDPVKSESGIDARQIDSYLLIDEADMTMSKGFRVLSMLMAQGRKYGCGVFLASQFLQHFDSDEDYWMPISTWLIHNANDITKNNLKKIVRLNNADDDLVGTINDMGLFNCLYKSYNCKNGRSVKTYPFYKLIKEILA